MVSKPLEEIIELLPYRVLVIGQKGSGKTTLINEIKKDNRYIKIGQNRYTTVDFNIRSSRADIQQKLTEVNAIIAVIDTDDDQAQHQAKQELDIIRALNMVHNLPIAVFGTKVSVDLLEFRKQMNLTKNKTVGKNLENKFGECSEVFMCGSNQEKQKYAEEI